MAARKKVSKKSKGCGCGLGEWVPESQTFADLLSKKWRTVKYDRSDLGYGTANLGGLHIAFRESGSDPAVIVNITSHPYLKGEAKMVAKALESIRKIMAGVRL